jgi:hypothetical protein
MSTTIPKAAPLSHERLLEKARRDPHLKFEVKEDGSAVVDWKGTAKANFRQAGKDALANSGFTETRSLWRDEPIMLLIPGFGQVLGGAMVALDLLGGIAQSAKNTVDGAQALVRASRDPFETLPAGTTSIETTEKLKELLEKRREQSWPQDLAALNTHPGVQARRAERQKTGDYQILSANVGSWDEPVHLALGRKGLGVIQWHYRLTDTPSHWTFTSVGKADPMIQGRLAQLLSPEQILAKILSGEDVK